MLRLASDVRFRRVLDEGVMLRLGTGEIIGLNGVGARVVELLSERDRRRGDLAATLRAELKVPEASDVESDVARFVDELMELGALLDEEPSA